MSRLPPLVYIAGSGRSGTTLLGRILGGWSNALSVGEAARFLANDRMFQRHDRCGCGAELSQCPFWRETIAGSDAQHRLAAQNALGLRNLRPLIRELRRGQGPHLSSAEPAVRHYLDAVSRTGSREQVVVDTSKHPANLIALLAAANDVHVVHVFRDPAAIVASFSKQKGYLKPRSSMDVVREWLVTNSALLRLASASASYTRLEFEDLCIDPSSVLGQLGHHLGRVTGIEPVATAGREVEVTPQHVLAGNPDKFSSGTIRIAARPWSLGISTRLWVRGLTGPLRHRLRRQDGRLISSALHP